MDDARNSWIQSVIVQHGDAIRSADPATQAPMRPNHAAWVRWFKDVPWVIEALDAVGTDISRRKLHDFVETSNIASEQGRRRAFVATLAWGVGSTNRYYGRHKQLLTSARLDDALRSSYEHLKGSRFEDSFAELNPLPGITYRFHTKWLWVVGCELGLEPMPLTFDNRVRQSLRRLRWPEMQRRQPQRHRWHRYVQDAGAVARRLDVSPEHVEY